MFRGRHLHAIDAKGRVSIPSKFREALNDLGQQTLVVTNDLDPCLAAYPMDEWLRVERDIQTLPDHIRELRQYKRFFISGAQECPIDRQGRILIPPSLRDYGQLSRECLFVGQLEKFEIWAPDLWQAAPEDPDRVLMMIGKYRETGPSVLRSRTSLE